MEAAADEVILRRQPPAGVYGVVRTPGLVSTLIALVTRSPYSHAFVVVDGKGTIIEAEPGGVRRANLDEYTGCRIALNTGEAMSTTQRAAVAGYANDKLGEPYAWAVDAADGLAALGIRWRILRRLAKGRKALMCSELVAEAGTAAELDWNCGQSSPAQVTPAMLAKRPGMRPWPDRG